jgi:hypothetical protein
MLNLDRCPDLPMLSDVSTVVSLTTANDSKLENYCRALFDVGADLASSAIHPR